MRMRASSPSGKAAALLVRTAWRAATALAIFHGPHRLADYDPAGNPGDDAKLAA